MSAQPSCQGGGDGGGGENGGREGGGLGGGGLGGGGLGGADGGIGSSQCTLVSAYAITPEAVVLLQSTSLVMQAQLLSLAAAWL